MAYSIAVLTVFVASGSVYAQPTVPPKPKAGDALLKTDILGVFAHPDDETGIAATLAYYARGRTSVVANVYCTRGEGGGNMVGRQWGAALGNLREAELRDCLNTLGVRFCYFLDRLDWAYTESATATLRKWGKEETLERLVRLVRELRPEVIVTMNPAPTPGQHGHHQSAGILATEAFSAAADPNRFPLQLTKEGLQAWQPRKLYYGGGTTGLVATIDVAETLPDGETPASIAGRALANHRSQAFGNFSNSPWLTRPQHFTLVKSFVPISASEADLLASLPTSELKPMVFAPPHEPALRLEFEPRPAVANYLRWAAAEHIEHVAAHFHPDLPVVAGVESEVFLDVINRTGHRAQGELTLAIPPGWKITPDSATWSADAGASERIQLRVQAPSSVGPDVELAAHARSGEKVLDATARLHPVPHAVVPRVTAAPSLDGSDQGWNMLPPLAVSWTNVWEGKVRDAADSSAIFRLAHDGRTLFVDVQVKDDAVVSNIAPDDIRGHWRSDSIEICVDPVGGAEDTMGCFKLGVFPFDSTGVVRAERDADANQGLVEETAPGVRLISRRTSDGYRIQASIPFAEIGIKPGHTQGLGFNLLVYDGDKRDAAPGENINKSRIAWSPRSGVMGRPEDWGRIDLE